MTDHAQRHDTGESPRTAVEIKRDVILSLGPVFTQDLWPYVNKNPVVRELYWRRLRAIMQHVPEKVELLLDFGTGAGLFLPTYSRLSRMVFALDLSINPLAQRLLNKMNCGNVHLGRSDARLLCIRDETFDLVVAANVLEHIPDMVQALNEIRRVLKPRGLLISVSPYENALRHAARFVLRKSRPDHMRDARGVLAGISGRFKLLDVRNLPWNSATSLSFFQMVTAQRD